MPKKTWNDFTNGELIKAYSNTYNWKLKQKLLGVINRRGITLSDIYYGNYNGDEKYGKTNSTAKT